MKVTKALREIKQLNKSYNKWFKADLYELIKEQIREGYTLKQVLQEWINQYFPIRIEENKDDTILYCFYIEKFQKIINEI